MDEKVKFSRRMALALASPVFTTNPLLRSLFAEGVQGKDSLRELTQQQKHILRTAEQELHLAGLEERLEELLKS